MARPLILYTGLRGLDLERQAEVEAAHDLGFELAVAGPANSGLDHYPIDHFIATTTLDFDRAETAIIDYLRQHRLSPQGIVAWTDAEVELVARLGQQLKIKLSSPNAAHRVRNKAAMRRALDQVSSANPCYAIVSTKKDLWPALEQVGYPALLKPAGASGSRGIFEIADAASAMDIFDSWQAYCQPTRDPVYGFFSDQAVLEQKLTGSEHSVAGIVDQGQVLILAISDKRASAAAATPVLYQTNIPSQLDPTAQASITQLAHAAVTATGIERCGFHIDLMMTVDGPKILEIGGRLGGECINSHLIPLASSGQIKPYHLLLALFHPDHTPIWPASLPQYPRQVAFRHILPPRAGRISSMEGLEHLRQHPGVCAVEVAAGEGDRLYLPHDKPFQYAPIYFVIAAEKEQNVNAIADQATSLLKLEVTP